MDLHDIAMVAIFIVGYLCISLEHFIRIDKATIALLTGISCWVIQYHHFPESCGDSHVCLADRLSGVSQVVFFLLGAMTIVEIISAHQGFASLSEGLKIKSKRKMLLLISLIAFCLSSVLDNLTTTIVMVTLLSRLVKERQDRWIMGAAVVIAANAGGAWTPIGDVTTTMLWIGGQITTVPIMRDLFLPSVISCFVACFCLAFFCKGEMQPMQDEESKKLQPKDKVANTILFFGVAALIFVPIFKVVTGLPPFMGVFLGLSMLWIATDIILRGNEEKSHLRVSSILSRLDISGLLFFVGILLAIDALEVSGMLHKLAMWLETHVANTSMIATAIGLASAIVDNVPLVAAAIGMYSLEQFPTDHYFWQLIAYCAGTGGSILIIGSAAGIVYMGMEKVTFGWYLRRISLPALAGYFAGIITYLALKQVI